MPMDNPQKVTAYLKVTAEFYDPDATPETVRACVEQDLTDAGYEVEVVSFDKDNNVPCKWIPVKDRLPPEHDSIFAKVYGTKQWNPNMFQRSSDDVRVAVRFEDGTRMVTHDKTIDGKWCGEKDKTAYPKRTVTHWMKNPELPEET